LRLSKAVLIALIYTYVADKESLLRGQR